MSLSGQEDAAVWHRILRLSELARVIRNEGSSAAVAADEFAAATAALRSETLASEPGSSIRDLYLPLVERMACGPLVIGQMGQSLDGRIATESGHSHYINGAEGLDHLHRLRALMDAVVVGVGTVVADNPRLTTRRVSGPDPIRVVIDPTARAPRECTLFHDGGATLVVTAAGARTRESSRRSGCEVVRLAPRDGIVAPAAIVEALSRRGLTGVLVEGGGRTVSTFLAHGQLHRLHVLVAPLLIGSGPPSLRLAPIATLDQALRFPMTVHPLGHDVLLDCRLR